MLKFKMHEKVKMKYSNEVFFITAIYSRDHTPSNYTGADYRLSKDLGKNNPSKYDVKYCDEDDITSVETMTAYAFKDLKHGNIQWHSSEKNLLSKRFFKRVPEFDMVKEV